MKSRFWQKQQCQHLFEIFKVSGHVEITSLLLAMQNTTSKPYLANMQGRLYEASMQGRLYEKISPFYNVLWN